VIEPGHAEFLDLNGNDVAASGVRVGIIPCVRVVSGSPGVRIVPTLQTSVNSTRTPILLLNWVSPPDPVVPQE
jgi:hypothetical protein